MDEWSVLLSVFPWSGNGTRHVFRKALSLLHIYKPKPWMLDTLSAVLLGVP